MVGIQKYVLNVFEIKKKNDLYSYLSTWALKDIGKEMQHEVKPLHLGLQSDSGRGTGVLILIRM